MKPTVVVGMSGGVDSSVSALLLKEQGYRVIGMFMKNWEEQDENGVCNASKEYDDVIRVCQHIGIPCYSVNFVKEYKESVFSQFLREFAQGHTPNPDILCNREIKFKLLLDKALELGGDFLATGHYCRNGSADGSHALLKGTDPGKDQSYFLYTIRDATLRQVLFPVGHLHKPDVRSIARRAGLPTAEKKDSTGICFIGERDFKEFLSGYLAVRPGNFETVDGKVVGQHDGVAFYTIGQRKGLGIGGPGDAWFVVDKDPARNIVFLGQGKDHPALFSDSLVAVELSWVSEPPSSFPYVCRSKIRYRQPDQECVITHIEEGRACVHFPVPQRAITLRQSVVFYEGDRCVGGGMIESRGPSYFERGEALPKILSP
jgi:tRNA-specific 2-thiouridylase